MRVFTSANPVEMDHLPGGKTAHAVAVMLLGDRAVEGVNYTFKVDGVVVLPDSAPPKSATVVEIVEYVHDPETTQPAEPVNDAAVAAMR